MARLAQCLAGATPRSIAARRRGRARALRDEEQREDPALPARPDVPSQPVVQRLTRITLGRFGAPHTGRDREPRPPLMLALIARACAAGITTTPVGRRPSAASLVAGAVPPGLHQFHHWKRTLPLVPGWSRSVGLNLTPGNMLAVFMARFASTSCGGPPRIAIVGRPRTRQGVRPRFLIVISPSSDCVAPWPKKDAESDAEAHSGVCVAACVRGGAPIAVAPGATVATATNRH